MKLPFAIEKLYTTTLSFEEIHQELEKKEPFNYFGGLRVDRYNFNLSENTFSVQRYASGISAFLERFPLIKGEIVNRAPTRVFLTLRPNFFAILFFSIFTFGFGYACLFSDNWTLNGIKRPPTPTERAVVLLLGSGIPSLWCYLQHIRPVKRVEKWIVKKLELMELK